MLLSRSRSSNVFSKPNWLLTIAPDSMEDTFKGGNACGGRSHQGLQFKHVAFVKLPGFVVHPVLTSLLPTAEQFLGQRRQPRPACARDHVTSPSGTSGPALVLCGAAPVAFARNCGLSGIGGAIST